MSSPVIQWKRLPHNNLPLPAYQTDNAAGFDLQACLTRSQETLGFVENDPTGFGIGLFPYQDSNRNSSKALVPTGFQVAIPDGYELQIRPRSGIACMKNIIILNSPGTIDSDYRGEIIIGLKNLGTEYFIIHHGMRIAQAVLAPVIRAEHREVETLSETARGEGGFGSTGV